MKKNISINLQGIIFHIEEDGFEVLSRYLAEVKAHFANYRGHEDIVTDIEGRVAELFAARLSPVQQVISLADVQAMMAKMGRVSDFAPDTDEDDEVEAPAATAANSADTFGPEGAFADSSEAAASGEDKRLYRDIANRKIAGVAAGIAQYFTINPLWIRLAFVFSAVFSPAVNIWSRHNMHVSFGGWVVLVYLILWSLLPKRYDAPAHPEALLNSGPLAGRRLFRDTGTGKVAGVAAGLAAYFRIDATLVRVLMLAGLFAGGFSFLLYVILWIVLPEAKTVSDKLRMRGDAITLESFDSSARNSIFDESYTTATNRPVGAFVEDAARSLRPAVNFVGSSIRVVAGVLLTLVGFVLLLAVAVCAGAGVGLLPASQHIMMGSAPAHVMLQGVPGWTLLSWLLAAGIPALWLLLGGLNLLFRRTILTRTGGLSLLGLWLLSLVGTTAGIAQQSQQHQYDAEAEQLEQFPKLTAPVLLLDARRIERQWEQKVTLRLAAADSGKAVELLRTFGAKGPSEEVARRNALTTIDYTVRPRGDSSLIFDDHFSFLPNAAYRDQELALTLRLPRDRTFRISRSFANDLLNEENFVGNRRPEAPEQHRYRLRGNKLECIACTAEQLGRDAEDEDGNVNINLDSNDDDETSDRTDEADQKSSKSGLSLNYGGAPAFDTDLGSYGSGRRSFPETGFSRVSVAGGYRVVVRHGDAFKIEAAGEDDVLEDLEVERDGSELQIRPRRTGLFGGDWSNKQRKVLIRIQLPGLDRLALAGAVHADLGGFERQDELRVAQAGASHLRLNGSYGTLRLDQAGACRTTATGSADNLRLEAAGACELAAANLKTRTSKVAIAGVCKARLHVTERLEGDAVGASVVAYSGNPARVKLDAVGPSSIKRL